MIAKVLSRFAIFTAEGRRNRPILIGPRRIIPSSFPSMNHVKAQHSLVPSGGTVRDLLH